MHLATGMDLYEVGFLLLCHFIGDFVLQDDYMALNKSRNNWVLAGHCSIYTLCFFCFGGYFMLCNFAIHFCVDFVTSRINARLYEAGERHWFFVAIGADQLLHFWTLLFLVWYWQAF